MTDIQNVLYPPKERDTRVSHRRYDGKERLIAWSVRKGEHFLVLRVDTFREVTLANGETLDVPETIQCRFSEQEIEPNAAFADESSISYDASNNPEMNGSYSWAGREVEAETELQFARVRWLDSTVGRWITGDPLGCEATDGNKYPCPDQAK